MKKSKQNNTKEQLNIMHATRNAIVQELKRNPDSSYLANRFTAINASILQSVAEIATYKTLSFLMANNASNNTATATAENGNQSTYGYNMSIKLLKTFNRDTKVLHNLGFNVLSPENDKKSKASTLSDCADIINECITALLPFYSSKIALNLATVIYTKVCQNGSEKSYNIFQFACKSIRSYINGLQQKQYKKQYYTQGYTDNGTEILTTKRPKTDLSVVDEDKKIEFLEQFSTLTVNEHNVLLLFVKGYKLEQIATELKLSYDNVRKIMSRAKAKLPKPRQATATAKKDQTAEKAPKAKIYNVACNIDYTCKGSKTYTEA